jgi:hypothetical protein
MSVPGGEAAVSTVDDGVRVAIGGVVPGQEHGDREQQASDTRDDLPPLELLEMHVASLYHDSRAGWRFGTL